MTDLKDCAQFTRKEVKDMPYQKPEIVSLGHATELILGGKIAGFETSAPFIRQRGFDSELDD